MKRRLFLLLWAVALWAAAPTAHSQPVSVETYSANQIFNISLPGTPQGSGLQFNGSRSITSIDFAPGSVVFQGQPVDFDGHEPQWIASTTAGTAAFPVNSGPGTTPIAGAGNVVIGTQTTHWNYVGQGIVLGPTFGANRMDVQNGSPFTVTAATNDWRFSDVAPLVGRPVRVTGNFMVTSVDAVNGIVNANSNGAIIGDATLPSLTTIGLIVLAIGAMGLGAMSLRRRLTAPVMRG